MNITLERRRKMSVIIAVLCILACAECGSVPKSWKLCKQNDPNLNACMKDAVSGAITDLMLGNPTLGVMSIDPLHINVLSIKQGSGPVSINLDITNVTMLNIKYFEINSIENDWNVLKTKVTLPKGLRVLGNYKIDGKVLLLPIRGEGPCDLMLDYLTAYFEMKFSEKDIKGQNHVQIDKFDFDFDSKKLHIKLDNLFNGNKALGDNMNKFLNDNSDIVLAELKKPLAVAMSMVFSSMAREVFARLTKDDIVPTA